jgi:hypothetical protein
VLLTFHLKSEEEKVIFTLGLSGFVWLHGATGVVSVEAQDLSNELARSRLKSATA